MKGIKKLRDATSAKAYSVFEDVEDLIGIGSNQDKLKQGLARLDGLNMHGIEGLVKKRDAMRVGISRMIDDFATRSVGDWNEKFKALILQLNAEGKKFKSLKIREEWREFIAALPEDTIAEESQQLYDEVLDQITRPMFEADLKKFEDMDDLSNVDMKDIEFMGWPESLEARKQLLMERIRIAKQIAEFNRQLDEALNDRDIEWAELNRIVNTIVDKSWQELVDSIADPGLKQKAEEEQIRAEDNAVDKLQLIAGIHKSKKDAKRLGMNLSKEPDLEKRRKAVSAILDYGDAELIGMKRKLLRRIEKLIEEKVLAHAFYVFDEVDSMIGFGSNMEKLQHGLTMLEPVDVGEIPDLIRMRDNLRTRISGMIGEHRSRTLKDWNKYFRNLCLAESLKGNGYKSYKAGVEWKEFISKLMSEEEKNGSQTLYDKTMDEITRPMFEANLTKFEKKQVFSDSDLSYVEAMVVPPDMEPRRIALIEKIERELRDMRDREEEDSFSDASSSDDDGSDSSTDGFGNPAAEFRPGPKERRAGYLQRIQNAAKKFPTSRDPAKDAPDFAEDLFGADLSSDDSDSSAKGFEGGDEGVGEDDDEDGDENDDDGDGGDESVDHYDGSVVSAEAESTSLVPTLSSVAQELVSGSSGEESLLPKTIEGLKSSEKKAMTRKNELQRSISQLLKPEVLEEIKRLQARYPTPEVVKEIKRLQVQIKEIEAEIKRLEKKPPKDVVGRPAKKTVSSVGRSSTSSRAAAAAHVVPKVFTDMSFDELIDAIGERERSMRKLDAEMVTIRGDISIQEGLLRKDPEKKTPTKRQDERVSRARKQRIEKIALRKTGLEGKLAAKQSLRGEKEAELVEIRYVLGQSKLKGIKTLLEESRDHRLISIEDLARKWNVFMTNGSLPSGVDIAGKANLWRGFKKLIENGWAKKFHEGTLKDDACVAFKGFPRSDNDPSFNDCH